jgi:hypothetical protein
MSELWDEIWDEFTDFFEDFWEHLKRTPQEGVKSKTAVVGGVKVAVRPAYLFAERIDSLIKIVFGISLTVSAFTATFFGFASLSQLVEVLINSVAGRLIMFTIGVSYLVIAFWKLLHLNNN